MAHQIEQRKFDDGRKVIIHYFFDTVPLPVSLSDVSTLTADKWLTILDWVFINGRIDSMIDVYRKQIGTISNAACEELNDTSLQCRFSWNEIDCAIGGSIRNLLRLRSTETVDHYIKVKVSPSKISRISRQIKKLNKDIVAAKQLKDVDRLCIDEPVESSNDKAAQSNGSIPIIDVEVIPAGTTRNSPKLIYPSDFETDEQEIVKKERNNSFYEPKFENDMIPVHAEMPTEQSNGKDNLLVNTLLKKQQADASPVIQKIACSEAQLSHDDFLKKTKPTERNLSYSSEPNVVGSSSDETGNYIPLYSIFGVDTVSCFTKNKLTNEPYLENDTIPVHTEINTRSTQLSSPEIEETSGKDNLLVNTLLKGQRGDASPAFEKNATSEAEPIVVNLSSDETGTSIFEVETVACFTKNKPKIEPKYENNTIPVHTDIDSRFAQFTSQELEDVSVERPSGNLKLLVNTKLKESKTTKHEITINSEQPQEPTQSTPPNQINYVYERSSFESNSAYITPDDSSESHMPSQKKRLRLDRSSSSAQKVAKSNLHDGSEEENTSTQNTNSREKLQRKAKTFHNYKEESLKPERKISDWLITPSNRKGVHPEKAAAKSMNQPSGSKQIAKATTGTTKKTNFDSVEQKILRELNSFLQAETLPDIVSLDLKKITIEELKTHFNSTVDELLFPYFEKYCKRTEYTPNRNFELPVYFTNYLLTGNQQLAMISMLQDHFSSKETNLDELFWEVMMPEWSIALFMSTFNMNRIEAIARIKLQMSALH